MNTLDKVIQAGEIPVPEYHLLPLGAFHPMSFLFYVILVAFVAILIKGIVTKDKNMIAGVSVLIILNLMLCGANAVSTYKESKITYAEEISLWKESAKEYITSLESKNTEITYFKISKDQPPASEFWYGNKSTINPELLFFTTVTLENGETVSGWYLIKEDLTPADVPYIEYLEVEKDLGHSIEKGLYNGVVHLPSDYLKKKSQ